MDISIIMPTLNEEGTLPESLGRITKDPAVEVIVADGGSRDRTVEIAHRWGARVIAARPGRAVQMNEGASRARGRVFLFLHADTILPPQFSKAVMGAAGSKGFAMGAFLLAFRERDSAFLRFVAWTANLRSKNLGLPYGDQGIFVKRETFIDVGGYPDIPIMEDVAFVRRVSKRGRVIILPQYVLTSARRYKKDGLLRRVLINKAAILGFALGMDPSSIARLYERDAKKMRQD